MILEKLLLVNFGLYAGLHEYDLRADPAHGKPVILIRGHNGGGKTTFLEAVRLALYGRRALGARVGRADYEAYLEGRIHRFAEERGACVGLVFSRHEAGELKRYTVLRHWSAKPSGVVDTLEIERDGATLKDVPEDDWEHYLQDLIPPGVSQLFFFDGEKIQDIADTEATEGLRDAIRALLGLELIDQLRGDLALYTARQEQSDRETDLEQIERDLVESREALILAEEEAAALASERDVAANRIERAQRKFIDEGGAIATDRANIQKLLATEEKKIEALLNQLKRLANTTAPLSLAPSLVRRLRRSLKGAHSSLSGANIATFIDAFEAERRNAPTKRPSWTAEHFKALRVFLKKEAIESNMAHLEADPVWMTERLAALDAKLRQEAKTLTQDLDEAYAERDRLKLALKGFDESAALDALESLKSAENALGGIEAQLKAKRVNADAMRYRIETLEKDRRRFVDAEAKREQQESRVALATRARSALATYETRILAQRLDALSSHFVTCFNGLIRKPQLVNSVRVDPDTFEIALVGEDGCEIDKHALSAGERQIFAVSMLWALGKTSGRELPVIIDTPLSRLDRKHRQALMEDYVPSASDQVILLCTDTELTPDLADLVAPHVAKSYKIGVGENFRRTSIAPLALEGGELARAH